MKLFILSTLFTVAAMAAQLQAKVACRIDDPGTLADLGGIQSGQLMEVESHVDEVDSSIFSSMFIEGEPMLEAFPFPLIFSPGPDGNIGFSLVGKVVNDADRKSLEIAIGASLAGEGRGVIDVVYQDSQTGTFAGHATIKECARVQ